MARRDLWICGAIVALGIGAGYVVGGWPGLWFVAGGFAIVVLLLLAGRGRGE